MDDDELVDDIDLWEEEVADALEEPDFDVDDIFGHDEDSDCSSSETASLEEKIFALQLRIEQLVAPLIPEADLMNANLAEIAFGGGPGWSTTPHIEELRTELKQLKGRADVLHGRTHEEPRKRRRRPKPRTKKKPQPKAE